MDINTDFTHQGSKTLTEIAFFKPNEMRTLVTSPNDEFLFISNFVNYSCFLLNSGLYCLTTNLEDFTWCQTRLPTLFIKFLSKYVHRQKTSTYLQIEFQSDDVTKMIFLKLLVSFNCSEQPSWKKFTCKILAL